MWRISTVRKDNRNFGSALVQMSASLLKMLPIASLKDKKQCPIHFGDTLDENKKEKKEKYRICWHRVILSSGQVFFKSLWDSEFNFAVRLQIQ